MSTHADEEQDDDEIRSEQHQQDFTAVEIKDAADQDEPHSGEKTQRKKKPAGWADVRGGAEKDIEGVKEEEDSEKEDGETRPAVDGEPSTGEREVEPAGNKEMEKEGGECRGEEHERLGGELRLRKPGMKQKQGESHKEEKAGEIIALIERQGTKRHPIAKKKNHGERDGDEFEKESREGWKRGGAGLCGRVAAECFAEKRASEENDAA